VNYDDSVLSGIEVCFTDPDGVLQCINASSTGAGLATASYTFDKAGTYTVYARANSPTTYTSSEVTVTVSGGTGGES
jgi:hypothetical protein